MIDLTPVMNAVISLMALLITTFLIPYIKRKTTAEQLTEIMKWVKIAVESAEMIFTESGLGAKKKEYVKNFLSCKGYDLDFNEIDALIEACVHEMGFMHPAVLKFHDIDEYLNAVEPEPDTDTEAETPEGDSE